MLYYKYVRFISISRGALAGEGASWRFGALTRACGMHGGRLLTFSDSGARETGLSRLAVGVRQSKRLASTDAA
jgi:hypothetical protein